MSNNINSLPSVGDISLSDIANAFYLYKSYSDGLSAAIDSYYGDLIKYYSPFSPKLPLSASKTIGVDVFHGKRYALPVPLTINTPVNNYNVFDNANAYTMATYGLPANVPGVPFVVTVTNNSIVDSTTLTAPNISTGTANFTTPGNYTWTVPSGVTLANIIVTGGGGGGGYDGGGGGGGAQVRTVNNISVVPGTNLAITVGTGGVGGTLSSSATNGNATSIASYTALGGGAGLPSGGDGGAAGGTGGSAGGRNNTTGGTGGITLTSPYGKGGNGGGVVSPGNSGTSGAVLITYTTTGGTSTNTQNTAAIIIGTSTDGSRTFNQYTTIQLINNGSITGKADTSGARNYSGSGSFAVNEGQTSVSYDVAAGGGSGGYAGAADQRQSNGGTGGRGGHIYGSMPVDPNATPPQVVSFTTGAIYLNNVAYAYATNGGQGQNYNGATGANGGWAGPGTGSASGGGGGSGEGVHDGRGGSGPGAGGGGWANVSYQPVIAGGPAIYVTKTTSILNKGTIAGGQNSVGGKGAGYSIIGKSYVSYDSASTGTVLGTQI
jgi:hypothetical protein